MAEQTLIHSASLRRSLYCFPRSHCTAFVSSFALSWWLFLWISSKFPHFLMPLPTSPLPTEGSSGHPPQLPQVPFFDLFFSLHFSWSNTCLFKYFSRLVSVSLFDVSSRRAGIFVDIVHCRISGILGSVSQVIGIITISQLNVQRRILNVCSVAQLCLTLRSMDGSPPGSSVHGIIQARILEWVAFPSPRILNGFKQVETTEDV